MSRIRSRNTSPERAVRHALWHKGYRYRLNAQRLDTLAWTVITVWECELGKNTDATIARLEAGLRAAKEKYDKWTALRRYAKKAQEEE